MRMSIQDPIFIPSFPNFFDRSKPEPTRIVSESNTGLSGMKGFLQQYSADQTNAYQTKHLTCLKVVEYQEHCIMLEFLSNLLSEGLAYRIINGYRSALLAYHEKVDGIPIGQHPKVCQILSGSFNKRPPQPKQTAIWDISKVTDYISTLGNDGNLSTKIIITLKLTTLLFILSSSRASETIIWTSLLCSKKTQ